MTTQTELNRTSSCVELCRYKWGFMLHCADQVYRFPMTFRLAQNYPVDLYFLMDVSRTMRSYKDNLVALSDRLGRFYTCFFYILMTITACTNDSVNAASTMQTWLFFICVVYFSLYLNLNEVEEQSF